MTRKDYVAVSEILSRYQDVMDKDDYFEMVTDFGRMMKLDNTRFDLSRFMIACGIDTKGLVTRAMEQLPPPVPATNHVAFPI